MRSFHSPKLRFAIALLFLTGFVVPPGLQAEDTTIGVDVADATTSVQLATVLLSVGTMTVKDGNLVGSYAIEVPLLKSKSESGHITLELVDALAVYLRKGGTISGEGVCETLTEDRFRKIEALFSPYDSETNQGEIVITIETSQRTFKFSSTYTLASEDSTLTE